MHYFAFIANNFKRNCFPQPPSPTASTVSVLNDDTTDLIERLADVQQEKWQLEEKVGQGDLSYDWQSVTPVPRVSEWRHTRGGEKSSRAFAHSHMHLLYDFIFRIKSVFLVLV